MRRTTTGLIEQYQNEVKVEDLYASTVTAAKT